MKRLIPVLLIFFAACTSQEAKVSLQPLNLLQYGAAITIQAPDSAKVTKGSWGLNEEITIEKGDYNVQLIYGIAQTRNLPELKAKELEDIQANPYFTKTIHDDDKGFIYETEVDSIFSYDFIYLHLQGDQFYRFSGGIASQLSQKQAEQLYNAVAQ